MAGQRIIVAAWVANTVFAVVVIPAALGLKALDDLAVWVSLGLFLVSLPVWIVALVHAAIRTARGDDVTVMGLFFLSPRVGPRQVQHQFAAALILSIVIAAATAVANPFSVLVPMLPLGLMGLWGARHGVYPPRRQVSKR
jgi:hypothetical protein